MYKKKMTGSAIRTRDAINESAERNHCAMPNTMSRTCSLTMLVSLSARGKKKKLYTALVSLFTALDFLPSSYFDKEAPKTNVATLLYFFPP